MNISKRDEYAHTPAAHSLWRESHYFNFYDHKQNIGGFTTIAVMPNKGQVEAGLVIVKDNMLIYAYPFEGTLEGKWDELCFGGISYEPIRPLDTWKIKLEDEGNKMDLTFKRINPVYDYGNDLGVLTTLVGTRHYEHSGTVNGTMTLEGHRISFSGFGERDHSWGVRNWHGCKRWVWFSVQFERELAFNGWYAVVEGKEFVRGFVYDGEKNLSIKDIQIHTEYEDDKKIQKSMRFVLTDSTKRTFSMDAEALIAIPIMRVSQGHTTLLNEAFSRFRYDNKTGFGITEYLWTEKCL